MAKQNKKEANTNMQSYLLFYVVFLIPSLILIGFFFTSFIAPRLWYEWDSLPFFDLFTLPSKHNGGGAHFIASPVVVYVVWIFFLLAAFLIPVFLTKKVIQERNQDLFI